MKPRMGGRIAIRRAETTTVAAVQTEPFIGHV
jgi:hypothetical protein